LSLRFVEEFGEPLGELQLRAKNKSCFSFGSVEQWLFAHNLPRAGSSRIRRVGFITKYLTDEAHWGARGARLGAISQRNRDPRPKGERPFKRNARNILPGDNTRRPAREVRFLKLVAGLIE
jgi:hypothetical protein